MKGVFTILNYYFSPGRRAAQWPLTTAPAAVGDRNLHKILNKENCSILISIEKCDILTEIKLFFPIKGKVSMKELEEWVLAEKAWQ